MIKMISDYMEKGFLENIIEMFKRDKSLYLLIGDMVGDERSRVRIGAVALVEALTDEDSISMATAIPSIVKRLKDPNATIRGDAAYMLGIIGDAEALTYLAEGVDDENELVRETMYEAMEAIRKKNNVS